MLTAQQCRAVNVEVPFEVFDQLIGEWHLNRPTGLGFSGRYQNPPVIVDYLYLLSEDETGEVSTSQGAGCKKGDDQSVAKMDVAHVRPQKPAIRIVGLRHHLQAKIAKLLGVPQARAFAGNSGIGVVQLIDGPPQQGSISLGRQNRDRSIQADQAGHHGGRRQTGLHM